LSQRQIVLAAMIRDEVIAIKYLKALHPDGTDTQTISKNFPDLLQIRVNRFAIKKDFFP